MYELIIRGIRKTFDRVFLLTLTLAFNEFSAFENRGKLCVLEYLISIGWWEKLVGGVSPRLHYVRDGNIEGWE